MDILINRVYLACCCCYWQSPWLRSLSRQHITSLNSPCVNLIMIPATIIPVDLFDVCLNSSMPPSESQS